MFWYRHTLIAPCFATQDYTHWMPYKQKATEVAFCFPVSLDRHFFNNDIDIVQ